MTIGWHFDNTYSKLSDTFREEIKPVPVNNPELVLLNESLASELNLNFSNLLTSSKISLIIFMIIGKIELISVFLIFKKILFNE